MSEAGARPKSLTITTWLMAILNAIGYAIINWRHPAAVGVALSFTFFIGAGYVVLWFYWKGHNWARILVMLTCLLCFYNLWSLRSMKADEIAMLIPVAVKAMVIAEALLAAYLLYWLNTGEAKAFFKKHVPRPDGEQPVP